MQLEKGKAHILQYQSMEKTMGQDKAEEDIHCAVQVSFEFIQPLPC